MTDAPEKIWARVRTTSYTIGINREVGELRDWCEGYATPEIAQTCGSTEYTRSDIAQARFDKLAEAGQDYINTLKARIDKLEAALKHIVQRSESGDQYDAIEPWELADIARAALAQTKGDTK